MTDTEALERELREKHIQYWPTEAARPACSRCTASDASYVGNLHHGDPLPVWWPCDAIRAAAALEAQREEIAGLVVAAGLACSVLNQVTLFVGYTSGPAVEPAVRMVYDNLRAAIDAARAKP